MYTTFNFFIPSKFLHISIIEISIPLCETNHILISFFQLFEMFIIQFLK